jgi:hypothetical protein
VSGRFHVRATLCALPGRELQSSGPYPVTLQSYPMCVAAEASKPVRSPWQCLLNSADNFWNLVLNLSSRRAFFWHDVSTYVDKFAVIRAGPAEERCLTWYGVRMLQDVGKIKSAYIRSMKGDTVNSHWHDLMLSRIIGSWWGNRRERDHWEDLGVDGWIILRWISRRWDVGIWTGLGWHRIERVGGRVWVR